MNETNNKQEPRSFNTQPPEGGWHKLIGSLYRIPRFNTQPPEGGWMCAEFGLIGATIVSTHSRPKAAGGLLYSRSCTLCYWFQHTAARRRLVRLIWNNCFVIIVSTHSRPKAAGASLKSLAPSGFAAPISPSSQEKREREYNTAFSVTPAFAIS